MNSRNGRLVENTDKRSCKDCGVVHKYIGRKTNDAPCGTPLLSSPEIAEFYASVTGGTVVRPPDEMTVVIDDSMRKLPRNQANSRLGRRTLMDRMA